MKRFIGLLMIGVLIALTLAYSGSDRYEGQYTVTITGVAGSADSMKQDTIKLVPTMRFSNQLYGIFVMDSFKNNGTNATGWGIFDTVDMVLKGTYAGRYITLDSVRKNVTSNVLTTLLVADGIIWDSLIGERVDLIIRINDTLNTGPTTDSTARININYKILHKFRD